MTTTNRRPTSDHRAPAERKAPEDHKTPDADRYFSFEFDGRTLTFPEPVSVITRPGFIRKNRNREPVDLGFTVFETLAGTTEDGEDCLDAIDHMSSDEFNQMVEDFWKFADVPSGE